MKDEDIFKSIGPMIGAIFLAFILSTLIAQAAPPAAYTCPYCGVTFTTYEELVTHVQTEHPGERIPLPITWE